MEIRKITEDELDYVSAICLDPSIGSRQRKAMQDAMTARIQWLRRMMKKRASNTSCIGKSPDKKKFTINGQGT